MPACGIFENVIIFASLKHKEMETQDFHYTSTQNLIVPVVGDVIEDCDGQLWLVVGRTLKPNNVLVVHTKKMEGMREYKRTRYSDPENYTIEDVEKN